LQWTLEGFEVLAAKDPGLARRALRSAQATSTATPPPADPTWTNALATAAVAPQRTVEPAPTPAPACPSPTYLQLRRWLPLWVWHVARAISVTGLVALFGEVAELKIGAWQRVRA
jgi:hypothetical protein